MENKPVKLATRGFQNRHVCFIKNDSPVYSKKGSLIALVIKKNIGCVSLMPVEQGVRPISLSGSS